MSAPTVTITSLDVDSGNNSLLEALRFTATFSEDVTGFELADITVANGTAAGFEEESPSVYHFTVTPTADGAITVDIAAAAAQNAGDENSTAATQFTFNRPPTVTIAASSVAHGGRTKTGRQTFTITTSSDTADFATADITVTNATKSGFSGSGSSYTVVVTPMDAGEVTVTVAADAFTVSSVTNATGASFTYEFVLPEAVITSPDVAYGAESFAATRDFRIDYDVAPISAPTFAVTGGTPSAISCDRFNDSLDLHSDAKQRHIRRC